MRRRWPRSAAVAIGAALTLAGAARKAGADLEGDVSVLEHSWKAQGKVQRLEPKLFERGQLGSLLLPAAASDPRRPGCTTVAVLGVPSATFVLRFLPGMPSLEQDEVPEASAAGAAQLVRCDTRKAMLSRLAIEMRSPRAVVETITVEGPRPAPSLSRTLKHRDPGPIAPLTGLGPRPLTAPVRERLRLAEERAKRQAALAVARLPVHAETDGSGQAMLNLDTGCHRIEALGADGSGPLRAGVDLDLIVRSASDGRTLGVDQTESSDAVASLCVGQPTLARVQFVGALPQSETLLVHASFPLPSGLPERWGPEARGAMAQAVRAHHNRALGGEPVFDALGVQGTTALPVEVEPGACYLVGVAAIRGEPIGLAAAVEVGSRQAQNQTATDSGTALAFCAGGARRALLEIEARGAGLVWLAALWQTGRVVVGEVAE